MSQPTDTPKAIMPFSFNIGFSKDEDIERIFVTRLGIFQYLFEQIIAEQPNSIPQHHLVIGERGMGKSTLLHRIAVELRKPEHSDNFLPLTFPEEQYNVDRLSKFWLNCLDALGDALDRREDKNGLDELDANINQWEKHGRNITALEMYGHFEAWSKRFNQRIVLLVDNLNLIFGKISKEDQHQLRSILMQNSAPILVGASAHSIEEVVDYGAPFYDAFKVHTLKKLSFEEVLDTLKNLANITGNPSLVNKIYANRGRLQALYTLTGGTPRTLTMLFPLIQNDFSINIQTDLEAMVDTATALYKSRFEELSEQMQVIVDAIALHWDPVHLETLREITHYENSTLSPQIKRLYDTGWLNRLDAYKAKGSAYEISERFFNIWYLMRRSSRRKKRELICLTRFLNMLYAEELPQMARKMLKGSMEHADHAALHLAMADAVKSKKLSKDLKDRAYVYLMERAVEDENVLRDFEIPDKVVDKKVIDLVNSAMKFISEGLYEDAIKLLEDALKLKAGKSTTVWGMKGAIYMFQKDYVESEKAFSKAVELEYNNSLSWMYLGAVRKNLSKYEEAERALLNAVDIESKNARAWYELGHLYGSVLNRQEEAEKACLKAIEISNDYADAWNGLGNVYLMQESFKEAEKAYLKAIEYDPIKGLFRRNLSELYHNHLGQYKEAEEAYLKAIDIEPNDAATWNNLGTLYSSELSRYEDAEKAYLKAIELNSEFSLFWSNLGDLYKEKLSRYEDAEKAYLKAIELDDKQPTVYINLGILYHEFLGRYEDARKAFLKSIELDGNNMHSWLQLALLYHTKYNDFYNAEKAYLNAIKIEPNFYLGWLVLGMLYVKHGINYDKAENAFKKAIELDIDDEYGAWISLGNLYQDSLKKYDDAEKAYKRYLELSPHNLVANVNLIFLYRDKMNRMAEAKALFEKLKPEEGVADTYYLHAALFAYYDKNLGIAVEALKKALENIDGELPAQTEDDWWRFAAVAHNLGVGQEVLRAFEETGHHEQLRPFYVAIRALMEPDAQYYLNSVALEVREAAALVMENIKRYL